MSHRGAYLTKLAAAAVLVGAAIALQLNAGAQTLVIPDFRERPKIAATPAGPCNDCGVIRSIREIHKRRDGADYKITTGSPYGGAETRVVGALVVLPFGPGSTDKASFVGGAGTAAVNERFNELSYEVTVRMNDGTLRRVERRDGAQYNIGDHVRVVDGDLELLTDAR